MKQSNAFLLIFLLSFFVISMFFVSCALISFTVETIAWQADIDGYTQFKTNNEDYLGVSQLIWDAGSNEATMNVFELEIKKNTGMNNVGFGGIFCVQDEDNFFRILIHENGRYNIYKKITGTWHEIRDWTASSHLLEGYGESNIIRVEYMGGNNFDIYFNNQFIETINDTAFTGGMYGFYTGISTLEEFPDIPVDVRFKRLQPAP
ncbi:MAG: hypothetical protein JW904_14500 [Spirochaetales bacterium]|nr:hypothetical protein [Spirochaetales bacterium]